MNIVLIGEDGKLVGNISLEQARQLAKSSNKDLIMINAKTNTYRIADAGKLKYEQKQKEKQNKAKNKTHKIKEVKISPNTDDHDLNTKASHVKEFLNKGFKTKITMVMTGRQAAFKSIALNKLNNFISMILVGDTAIIDGQVKHEGQNIMAYLLPK